MKILITIVDRNSAEKISKALDEKNLHMQIVSYGRGTADSEMLEYFGIGGIDKEVMIGFAEDETVRAIFAMLSERKEFKKHGGGVAFTIPISSIGSKTLDAIRESGKHNENSTEVRHG